MSGTAPFNFTFSVHFHFPLCLFRNAYRVPFVKSLLTSAVLRYFLPEDAALFRDIYTAAMPI